MHGMRAGPTQAHKISGTVYDLHAFTHSYQRAGWAKFVGRDSDLIPPAALSRDYFACVLLTGQGRFRPSPRAGVHEFWTRFIPNQAQVVSKKEPGNQIVRVSRHINSS